MLKARLHAALNTDKETPSLCSRSCSIPCGRQPVLFLGQLRHPLGHAVHYVLAAEMSTEEFSIWVGTYKSKKANWLGLLPCS